MVSEYDAVEQLSCTANMIKYIIDLGGDFSLHENQSASASQKEKFLSKIFDRTKHSVQKLRHYRFVILGWIARLVESSEFKVKVVYLFDCCAKRKRLMHINRVNCSVFQASIFSFSVGSPW